MGGTQLGIVFAGTTLLEMTCAARPSNAKWRIVVAPLVRTVEMVQRDFREATGVWHWIVWLPAHLLSVHASRQ